MWTPDNGEAGDWRSAEITCRHAYARLARLPLRQQELVVGSQGPVADLHHHSFSRTPHSEFDNGHRRLAYESAAYFGYLILTLAGTASGPEAENSGGRGCRTPLCCGKAPWCRVVFRFSAGPAYTCLFTSWVIVEASWRRGHLQGISQKTFENKYPQTYPKSHPVPHGPSAS